MSCIINPLYGPGVRCTSSA
ncbi:hypothetical protein EE612_051192 [Oryza sativa]|nr:hypothetical protein EE612_051192 [Oryza sativa]